MTEQPQDDARDRVLGSDGLTDAQREAFRERFRNGMGKRPDPEEFRREADRVMADLPPNVVWISPWDGSDESAQIMWNVDHSNCPNPERCLSDPECHHA